jgi:hypothetical protein
LPTGKTGGVERYLRAALRFFIFGSVQKEFLMSEKYEWGMAKEINSPNDLTSETDYLRLWTEVGVEGTRLDNLGRKGLGEEYLEDLHHLFEYDGEFHDEEALSPYLAILPASPEEPITFDDHGNLLSGNIYQAHTRSRSPFLITRRDGRLVLKKNGVYLTELAYFPRPAFLNRKISDGTPAGQLVAPIGSYWLMSAPLKYCFYFQNGEQCRFCNITDAGAAYSATLNRKKTEQIAEAFAVAWEEGHYRGLSLCGGSLPGPKEQDQYLEITRAIKAIRSDWDGWNDGSVPVDYIGGAPKPHELHKIDEIKDAGVRFLQLNLEIGDPKWFEAVCPGKAINVGYDNWVDALAYGATVFGKNGRVRTHLVAGIEPADTLIKAFTNLGQKGVLAFANPWRPTPGSFMEGHRPPYPQWYFNLYGKIAETYIHSGFDFWKFVDDHAPRFFDISLPFHFWRARLGIKSSEFWKRAGGITAHPKAVARG